MQSVFSDDFESYLEGDSLDTDNAASPYNSSTSEATVGKEPEADAGGPGTSGNKIAEIIDTDAGDTGELQIQARMQMHHLALAALRWPSSVWTMT